MPEGRGGTNRRNVGPPSSRALPLGAGGGTIIASTTGHLPAIVLGWTIAGSWGADPRVRRIEGSVPLPSHESARKDVSMSSDNCTHEVRAFARGGRPWCGVGGSSASANRRDGRRTLGMGACRRRLVAAMLAVAWLGPASGFAQEPAAADPEAPEQPLGQFVTIEGSLDETTYARVVNTGLDLLHRAAQQDRPAVLVLEIHRGASKFGQVIDLAKELTSERFAGLKTVAWIPPADDGKPLRGYNVVLALACREIVMHPDAAMGDVGLGRTLDPDELNAVVRIAEKRHNPLVTPALVYALCDPQSVLLRVRLRRREGDRDITETRIITEKELKRLRENQIAIEAVETIKEAGVPGILQGRSAREWHVLASATATSRREVAALFNLPREALREGHLTAEHPKAVLIRIDGVIDPVTAGFVERELRRAVNAGMNLVIVQIDSPGGELFSSLTIARALADLEQHKIRTVAYVPERALSGGAIVALGCDEIYMHPDAKLGDAAPISLQPGGQFERAPEKILSVLREELRQLGERKNRPPSLLMAMADKDLPVYRVRDKKTGRVTYLSDLEIAEEPERWERGPLVPETRPENLLTVNGVRAHELQLAEPPVDGWEALMTRLGLPAETRLVPRTRSWVDTLVWYLNHPAVTFLLILGGILCLYLEAFTATGLFAIGAAVCFSLFFWSRFLGGTAGWLEVVLLVLGLTCLALEVFVIPGFGIFGISGILLCLASLVLASQTFVIPHTDAELHQMVYSVGTVLGAFLTLIAVASFLGAYLPKAPLLRRLVLTPYPQHDDREPHLDPRVVKGLLNDEPYAHLLHQEGRAVTDLRPAGKALIGGELVHVISNGQFVPAQTRVEVIDVRGNEVIVRPVEEAGRQV
ncbi:MAG: hypothetical protein D6725_08535 [Planctomycetota bacterium]|nr:MAG: hypothetical protein D6725_08535 [Planctomycetota bacterium]